TLRRLPDMLFVVDINTEDLAVMEANKLRIPIIAMVDTNSNPDLVEYVIPSNDDAIRAVKLIVSVIANAVEEGMRIREVDMADTGQVSKAELAEMEQYLGPSTLAKLKATVEDFDSYEEDDSGELENATDDSDDSDDEYDDFEYDDEEDKAVVAYSDDDDDE
ncbi:MAG: 30S ribosomal protein S2, partial [Caldilineaceae bacterium]|nr:30S ribosomal protein S2 [Caldilineaceae bacterium]